MRCKCHGVQLGVYCIGEIPWKEKHLVVIQLETPWPAHNLFMESFVMFIVLLVSCMRLHMFPTFFFLYFLFEVCVIIRCCAGKTRLTLLVCVTCSQLFLCVRLPSSLFSLHVSSSISQCIPFYLHLPPLSPLVFCAITSSDLLMSISPFSFPSHFFVRPLLLKFLIVFPSFLSCSLLLHALEVS